MKKDGEGIKEIIESGKFSTIYSFRVPQAWSHWKHPRKVKSVPERNFSIQTERGRDSTPQKQNEKDS